MEDRTQHFATRLAGASALGAVALALATPVLGASQRPGYDHCAQYISELGEAGAAHAAWVNYAGFLPTGALVVLFAVLAALAADRWRARVGLLLFSGVGLAYVVAAFFPCDPGCPSPGSPTQQIHSSGALAEYLGGALGLWLARDARIRGIALAPRWLAIAVAVVVLAAFGAMIESEHHSQRGLAQRCAEFALFGWLAVAGVRTWRASEPIAPAQVA